MCGIVGVLAKRPVNQEIYDALTIIQHRGQDAAGMITCNGNKIHLRKSTGLVRDVFRENHMRRLKGNIGIGHVRYPTAGTESAEESQPFYVNSPYGLSLVHNGNLVNTEILAEDLVRNDLRHLNTQSDSEVLLNVLAYELQHVATEQFNVKSLFNALEKVYQRVNGAYAAITMITGIGLLAFRDPHGIRPLVYGRRQSQAGDEFMFASENIALNALGYEVIADVAPGEAVFIDLDGNVSTHICAPKTELSPCIFEFIYLARPDTVIDRIPVYQARLAMGEKLAKNILKQWPDHDVDVVIPIPDTSRPSAISVAQVLGVTYCEGFVKNRYIGRTFIMPEQKLRRSSVRMKLNPIKEEFAGKNVLLIDDSVVRGTTSKEIIQMARDAGAKKVYFASAAPEVRYPNVYGIDMPSVKELIAHDRTVEQVADYIGADALFYQNLADVYEAINSAAKKPEDQIQRFEDSIFTGEYITGGIDADYLLGLEKTRSDAVKIRESE